MFLAKEMAGFDACLVKMHCCQPLQDILQRSIPRRPCHQYFQKMDERAPDHVFFQQKIIFVWLMGGRQQIKSFFFQPKIWKTEEKVDTCNMTGPARNPNGRQGVIRATCQQFHDESWWDGARGGDSIITFQLHLYYTLKRKSQLAIQFIGIPIITQVEVTLQYLKVQLHKVVLLC